MLTLLSPAKTLDFDTPPTTAKFSQCEFLEQAADLIDVLKPYSPEELGALMKLSAKLSELNVERYANWRLPFTTENAKQAVLAFKGDVYTGLEAHTLTPEQLDFAQQHVRILSGLYGVLKPLDLIQPYRLEMGTKLANPKGKDLYSYWQTSLTEHLNAELAKSGSQVVVNLASNEYFSAIKPKLLEGELISPVFKDEKNGKYKIISFYAKKARGLMARWIITHNLNDARQLTEFTLAGYRYEASESQPHSPVFKRTEKDAHNA